MKFHYIRFVLLLCLVPAGGLRSAPSIQTVFYDMPEALMPEEIPAPTAQLLAVPGYPDDPARFTLVARLYLPDPAVHGHGPHPVVVFLHGSGGMWPNGNTIPENITHTNSPTRQFRDWGDTLVAMGYACLFPDSLHPRGLPGSFEGRRPHHDPAQDDHRCSPNYERPKDVVAALEFLAGRAEIDLARWALVGFSHGAQTGMNVLLDASVDLGNYEVDFIDLVEDGQGGWVEDSVKKPVPSPVRIPPHLPVPKFCAFYYGGGGHFGYHGQASTITPGRYMLDRRTQAILFHGTGDSLMGIDDPAASPLTGDIYPIKQVLASAAQAETLGLPNPIVRHYIFNRTAVHQPESARVGHSFDFGSVGFAAPGDWDTANESPDQKARRLARDEVLRWLAFKLRPSPRLELDFPEPGVIGFSWPTRNGLDYRLQSSPSLSGWNDEGSWTPGNDLPRELARDKLPGGREFFRVAYRPIPMPVDAPEHEGFFVEYAEFGE